MTVTALEQTEGCDSRHQQRNGYSYESIEPTPTMIKVSTPYCLFTNLLLEKEEYDV